ncbi:patatin-like phospholipase [Fadolivirus algeromassiliense]|jgi:NTE family protein|uniref:Patatin-like phospholipase n=1 Tax=Fadolivirus FV1/VV64 TaxID=3070911 RepID=A0A7D3QXA8_9VIRU|nr:patatin-like phospholipase [Fadolivirus algeromassiliense]QKF94320.1 patatin-like phospholipase [Fadolivirus FV1/VV64]
MGLGNSKIKSDDEKQIEELKHIIHQQNDIINMLKSEVDVLRNYKYNSGLKKKDLTEINRVWEEKSYQYLVFSGGGIKGISYVGSLLELQKNNILYDNDNNFKIKGICGVSAGSIVAALLAVGYKPHELETVMTTIDFEEIADDKLGYIRDTINFIDDWGVCPGEYVIELMGNLIKQKKGNPDYTIEDLYNDTGIKLVIVTTDMTYQKSIYLYPGNPIKEFSKIPIRTAVRMSMGIPFAFEPYLYNGSYFVDGGVLDNYPLHVFDGEYPGEPKARLNLCEPNPYVLGLKIMTSNQIIDYNIVPKQKYDSLFQYTMAFINTFLNENDRRVMTPSFWIRSIILVTPEYALTDFELTDKEKEELICIGKNFVNEFFTRKATKNIKAIDENENEPSINITI